MTTPTSDEIKLIMNNSLNVNGKFTFWIKDAQMNNRFWSYKDQFTKPIVYIGRIFILCSVKYSGGKETTAFLITYKIEHLCCRLPFENTTTKNGLITTPHSVIMI